MNPLPPPSKKAREAYARHLRPKLARMLSAARLDVHYHRARGDELFCRDDGGREVAILDFLGGFGASFFGHNHPELVAAASAVLAAELPFNAQGSVRGRAAALGERLGELLHRRTGRRYVTTLASTGAECVEAAAKHALLANGVRVEARAGRLARDFARVQELAGRGALRVSEETAARLERLGEGGPARLAERLGRLHARNLGTLQPSVGFLAAARGFHGKTLGALRLTHNPRYRDPFAGAGLRAVFVDPDDPAAVGAELSRATRTLHPLSADGEWLRVAEEPLLDLCAIFVEPLQGEGGVHVVGRPFLEACREAATRHGIPLVLDEIQCGMGRTGTFLFSEQQGVTGDYYLLSKSLGGGLAKVSALLVDERLYEDEFGVLHTSTFAEDDHSASIALAALELLERDATLYENARARGEQLVEGLERLRRAYPDVIAAVRGRGLMVGVELADPRASGSALVRVLGGSGLLGYAVSGHLLHEHRIRVAPALSSTSTIRLEPSALVTAADCDRVLGAFGRLCEILHRQNAHALVGFLAREDQAAPAGPIADCRGPVQRPDEGAPARRVAFVGHFIEAGHLRSWDRSLSPMTDGELEALIDRIREEAEPCVLERHVVRSAAGGEVGLSFVGYFADSRVLAASMRARALDLPRRQLALAQRAAVEDGCTLLGLGGFTSIVTNNGTALPDTIAVTTGNSLTAGMGLQALLREAASAGLDAEAESAAVIGAAGNIASVYAEILAESVPRVTLVGRPGGEAALREVAARIYEDAAGALLADAGAAPGRAPAPPAPGTVSGVARAIRDTRAFRALRRGEGPAEGLGAWLADQLDRELAHPPVTVATSLSCLKEARLLVGASNSPRPILFPDMIAEGPVVVCDIALPHDADTSVMEREGVRWLMGGVVRLPRNPGFRVGGIPLEPGECFTCMAETLLCGLEGIPGNYSFGRIGKAQVKRITEVARAHGFELSRAKTARSL